MSPDRRQYPEGPGKVFISYRRADTEADAGRLYSDLALHLGERRLFRDVDSVPLASDVRRQIIDVIGRSALLIVLVGPNWRPERLHEDDDWVRLEIEEAMARGVPILPIRLRRAEMPPRSAVPRSMSDFCDLNAAELEHASWGRDLAPILAAVRRTLGSGTATQDRPVLDGDLPLVEYLFIDRKRVDSYLDQIELGTVPQHPSGYGSSPMYVPGRDVVPSGSTVHRKILRLIQYLAEQNTIQDGRIYRPESAEEAGQPFGLETFEAVPIWLPGKDDHFPPLRGLKLWFATSPRPRTDELLYLVEDFVYADLPGRSEISGLSILHILSQCYPAGFEKTIISDRVELAHAVRQPHGDSLDLDPIGILRRMGAQMGPPRVVTSLYRVRVTFEEYFLSYRPAVFAYPIFVAEKTDTFDLVRSTARDAGDPGE